MTLCDTHCHLDLERFDADRSLVIERAAHAGVSQMLVPSLNPESAMRVVGLSSQYAAVFAAVGVHPTEIQSLNVSEVAALRQLASAAKVVAIGEIGLDYYWVSNQARRLEQQAGLRAQLDLAEACELPVVLHVREQGDAPGGPCADDMLLILDNWVHGLRARAAPMADRAGVLHSFAGTLEAALHAIGLGFYIGVTGPITYPGAEQHRELVRQLPLERVLIETDSPFLAPQQHRGRRNEPAFVTHIADRIAQVQSRTPSEIARATSSNAARLFAWGEPD